MKIFRERLKELRLERNLKQKDVAKGLGVSQAAVARWEANLQIPNIDILYKVAIFFDVSADFLLGLTDYE